jgi:MFS family permease
MVFFLPLFLQNAYGYEPLIAGVAMLPFALPMVLAPRLTTQLSNHFSGRALLTAGLAITTLGNVLFWVVARAGLAYPVFVACMVVAGCGAGLLNGTTVKVMGNAVPADRAGMASGLASTTRFIGILLAVAGLGAVLANGVRRAFVSAATAAGLGQAEANAAATRVASGDLAGMLGAVPDSLRAPLHQAGLTAFSDGFAELGLIAAFVATSACLLTFLFVRSEDTAPVVVVMASAVQSH